MPDTSNGITYPNSSSHPRIWEHIQTPVEQINDLITAIRAPTHGSVQVAEATAQNNVAGTGFLAGSTNCEALFVAPVSGKVWVKVGGSAFGTTSSRIIVSFEIRTGTVAGAHFQVADDANAVLIDAATGAQNMWETLISGLTAGATYYVRTMHRSLAGGTGDIFRRSIGIQPTV